MAYIQHTHKKNIAVDRNKRCMLLLFFSFSLSEKDFVIEKGSKKKKKRSNFSFFFFPFSSFFLSYIPSYINDHRRRKRRKTNLSTNIKQKSRMNYLLYQMNEEMLIINLCFNQDIYACMHFH